MKCGPSDGDREEGSVQEPTPRQRQREKCADYFQPVEDTNCLSKSPMNLFFMVGSFLHFPQHETSFLASCVKGYSIILYIERT